MDAEGIVHSYFDWWWPVVENMSSYVVEYLMTGLTATIR